MSKKILHLASFAGNIGDIANHAAMHDIFQKKAQGNSISFSELEMRDFYRNSQKKRFDEKFLKEINEYDVFYTGGGNFFDVRWNESASGTTLDMSKSFIRGIGIPVVVNAMGFMNYYPEEKYKVASEKFYDFLTEIVSRNWKISVRNDGSKKRIIGAYGNQFEKYIQTVPDAAFLFNKNISKLQKTEITWTVGINLINELFDLRFTDGYDIKSFNEDSISFVEDLIQAGFKIIFFPHTPQDLKIMGFFSENLDEKYFRYSIQIAPYSTNSLQGALDIDKYYSMCDIVVGMRFHTCVLSLKNNIPTIALAVNERMVDFFEELDLSENCISLKQGAFSKIREQLDSLIKNSSIEKQKLISINNRIGFAYEEYVQSCLHYLGVVS